jgi:subtilase family serine protease
LFRGTKVALAAIGITIGLPICMSAFARVPATPAAVPVVTSAISDADTVKIAGEVSGAVFAAQDRGRVADTLFLPHLTLVLKRPAARQAALDRLVAAQLEPGNPQYGKWLSPAELRPAFGPADADIDRVSAWLSAHGFAVHRVTADGMTIDFAGTAGQVAEAFHAPIHNVVLRHEAHIANVVEPAIPRALRDVVAGITLHDFFPRPYAKQIGMAKQDGDSGKWRLVSQAPDFVTPMTPQGVFQAIGPNDITRIYNVDPLRAGASSVLGRKLTGAGATILVLEDSFMHREDWLRFRDIFGFSGYAGTLRQQAPGGCGDPGYNADEAEAALDVEYGSIAAPDANIILAACPSTNLTTNSGLFTALETLVSQGTPAQIISISYGLCEASYGPTALQAWSQAAEEGAAEGISIFVSTGDGGVDNCDSPATSRYDTSGITVNGLAANPYVTAVGGTDFSDEITGQGGAYFASHNRPGLESAKSYVPEIAWNQTCASPVLLQYRLPAGYTGATSPIGYCNSPDGMRFLDIVAGSGGRSQVYPKPEWQSLDVYGVPDDGRRDLPDLSLFASEGFWGHFYIICFSDRAQGGGACDYSNAADIFYNAYGGTSFAAPTFAGMMLLETQYRGLLTKQHGPVRIGNVAPRLYQLAAGQYATGSGIANCDASLGNQSASTCVFHNVTQNSNDVPCLKGTPDCATSSLSTHRIGVLSEAPGPDAVEAYPAVPGYSLATGLGSVDALNLIAAY